MVNDQCATNLDSGIKILAPMGTGYERVLTSDALHFLRQLTRTYRGRVHELLASRQLRQAQFERGQGPDFLDETQQIRERQWHVAPLPDDLQDRRVEITGPLDRKMIINALNSGASCFMADCEDSSAPTWNNMVEGQINLFDAVRRNIDFADSVRGKTYRLNEETATLFVRPRGWHLWEKHVDVDGSPIPAGLFDFGLYFFHNAQVLIERGTGPYFYLPKLESHLEARLWNDVFLFSQKALGVSKGTIKATVLIETLPAAFEMDEILFELKEHSAGLNCGRWDYIFSYVKTVRSRTDAILPDRSQVTMEQPFMRAYSQLAIRTCHRRGVHAIGGMAAQIPIKGDSVANEAALAKVRADKEREVRDGHDGTWVAHPGLVSVARRVFDEHMPAANQIERQRDDVQASPEALLETPTGTRTEMGLRHNISVGLQYLASWLGGAGCVPLYDLMEDAATAEISRAQLWQWVRHGATLEDGRVVTVDLFDEIMQEELEKLDQEHGGGWTERCEFKQAREIFRNLVTSVQFEDFLTLPAYECLVTNCR